MVGMVDIPIPFHVSHRVSADEIRPSTQLLFCGNRWLLRQYCEFHVKNRAKRSHVFNGIAHWTFRRFDQLSGCSGLNLTKSAFSYVVGTLVSFSLRSDLFHPLFPVGDWTCIVFLLTKSQQCSLRMGLAHLARVNISYRFPNEEKRASCEPDRSIGLYFFVFSSFSAVNFAAKRCSDILKLTLKGLWQQR